MLPEVFFLNNQVLYNSECFNVFKGNSIQHFDCGYLTAHDTVQLLVSPVERICFKISFSLVYEQFKSKPKIS